MISKTDFTAKQLMERWEIEPVQLLTEIRAGLPAYSNGRRIEPGLIDPLADEFNLLTFWIPDVERYEKGGAEAVAEARRLRYPLKHLKSEPELWKQEELLDLPTEVSEEIATEVAQDSADPRPAKRKRKMKKAILEARQEFVKYYEMWKNHHPDQSFKWLIRWRLTENVRLAGKQIKEGTFYDWKALHDKEKLFD